MSKATTPKLAPMDCESLDDVCKLRTDHKDIGDAHWIMLDGYHVSIAEQRTGEMPKQSIRIPREVFKKMVRWFTTPQ